MLIFTSFQHLSTMLADLFKSSDKCGTNVVANIENVLTGLMYTLTATTTPSQLTMKFIQLFFHFIYRDLLAFVFLPLIQKEMDIFRDTIWNSHRVRCQKDAQLPKGVPSHLYSFPENYGAEQCGMADN